MTGPLAIAALSLALGVPYLPQTDALCGGAAAAMVFRYWGDAHADPQEFASLVDRSAGGIADAVLVDAIRRRGWGAQRIDGSRDARGAKHVRARTRRHHLYDGSGPVGQHGFADPVELSRHGFGHDAAGTRFGARRISGAWSCCRRSIETGRSHRTCPAPARIREIDPTPPATSCWLGRSTTFARLDSLKRTQS